jgi:hypothetical protein
MPSSSASPRYIKSSPSSTPLELLDRLRASTGAGQVPAGTAAASPAYLRVHMTLNSSIGASSALLSPALASVPACGGTGVSARVAAREALASAAGVPTPAIISSLSPESGSRVFSTCGVDFVSRANADAYRTRVLADMADAAQMRAARRGSLGLAAEAAQPVDASKTQPLNASARTSPRIGDGTVHASPPLLARGSPRSHCLPWDHGAAEALTLVNAPAQRSPLASRRSAANIDPSAPIATALVAPAAVSAAPAPLNIQLRASPSRSPPPLPASPNPISASRQAPASPLSPSPAVSELWSRLRERDAAIDSLSSRLREATDVIEDLRAQLKKLRKTPAIDAAAAIALSPPPPPPPASLDAL